VSANEGLEVLGEVVGGDERQDVRLEGIEVRVVEGLDRRVLDGAVHPLGLAVRPGVVGFCEAVLDAVLAADAVEDVAAEDRLDLWVAATVPGQVGESHPVAGQHGVDLAGEGGHDLAQEGGAVQLGIGVEGGDVDELRDAVDGEEHEELAFGQAQLADIGVDIADPGLGEALPLGGLLLTLRQAGDAVPLQAAVQGAA
jgi:hypothetical protein